MADAPNPRSLKAAREQRKLDLSEVAIYTKISPARLEDFEAGSRAPSSRQVEQLSNLYNVPLYLLYLDATPNLETVLPDFRKPNPRPADLSPQGLVRLWAVEKAAVFAKQLISALSSKLPSFHELPTRSRLGADYAAEFRGRFDEWFNQRREDFSLSGPVESQYLSGLRLYYESCEQLSLVNEAPPNDYFGFYNEASAGLGAIFVNRRISSKKAQLFTFVHELGHSLLRREGISDPFAGAANSVERSCNSFAAEFLAPRDEFSAIAESVRRTDRMSVFSFVRSVSRKCLLSQQATAIRLSELDYIDRIELNEWNHRWRANPAREKEEEREELGGGGPGAYAKQVGEIGYLAVYLAGTATESKLIDSLDVQRGLGLSESVQDKAFSLAKRRLEAALR